MSTAEIVARRAPSRPKRFRWTLEKLERMIEAGIFDETDRVELIDGELYAMSPKGIRHENVRGALLNWLIEKKPSEIRMYAEPGWRPDGQTYCEPDFILAPAGAKPFNADPKEVLLVIEVARTSWGYDTGLKAGLYARLGVREYWTVDARRMLTRVHLEPGRAGYRSTRELASGEAVDATLIPGLSLRLDTLDLD